MRAKSSAGLIKQDWAAFSYTDDENSTGGSRAAAATVDSHAFTPTTTTTAAAAAATATKRTVKEAIKTHQSQRQSKDTEVDVAAAAATAISDVVVRLQQRAETTTEALEPIVHVFSHQRHTMHALVTDVHILPAFNTSSTSISTSSSRSRSLSAPLAASSLTIHSTTERKRAHTEGNSPLPLLRSWQSLCGGKREIRWMSYDQLLEAGVTTGCKKVLSSVVKHRKKK
jgi:hypothetical protein